MKKRIGLALIMLLTLTFVTACGKKSQDEVSGKGLKMYMTVSVGDTFRNALMETAKETAESMGATLELRDAEGSLENQLEQIKEAVEGGYDVILCNPVDVDTTLQLQVEAGDIPMVFWNSCPDESRLEANKYVFVGSNEEDAGKYQAEYILEKYADQDTINIAIMEGQAQHSATLGRTNALKHTLEDSGKKINYVFDDTADWDQEIAKNLFTVFLKTGQAVDCVACNNDSMALGVIDSCKENNIDLQKLDVAGVDATEDGCKAIVAGDMKFTVYQSATGQGEYAIKAAARLAQGKSLKGMDYLSEDEKYVWVPFEKVDAHNVTDYQ